MNGLPGSITLVGAGKMGGALLRGFLAEGVAPTALTVVDPAPSGEMTDLSARHGFALNPASPPPSPDVMILAVKPQMLDAVGPSVAGDGLKDTLLVSILAGKTLADLAGRLPHRALVRAMPNTPAAVRRGITGVFGNEAVTPAQRGMVDALFGCVGAVEWLERESLIDAVTAVSGSGPAYVFYLVECLAEAARAAGLEPAQADRFARATVVGAGALMDAEPAVPADQLRRNVTSPGGTTAAALDVLAADALQPLMVRAVAAARDRAVHLAG